MTKKRKRQPDLVVKLPRPMSFEEAVKHVLKAGPAPKPKAKRPARRRK